MIAYLKSPLALASQEFHNLPQDKQTALQAKSKPLFELISQVPNPTVKAPEHYLCTMVGFDGGGGNGEVRLQSADPKDPPLIVPKILENGFDRLVAIEAVRETLDLFDKREFAEERVRWATAPEGRGDGEIMVSNTLLLLHA